jgi:hypothetical protein
MLRKTIVVAAAAASIGTAVALSSTGASAQWGGPGWGPGPIGGVGWRGGGWGWRGPGWGARRVGWGWGGPGLGWGGIGWAGAPVVASVGFSCWRWVPTGWGLARVWVC